MPSFRIEAKELLKISEALRFRFFRRFVLLSLLAIFYFSLTFSERASLRILTKNKKCAQTNRSIRARKRLSVFF
jgi:hypothetical protein